MKTWQFVLGFTAVGVVLVQLLTPEVPEANAAIVQKIEEHEQIGGELRAIVRMHSPGVEAFDVDSIGYAIAEVLEEMQASREPYSEVVFAVEAPDGRGGFVQAFSVFYGGAGPTDINLAKARSRDVFGAGEPGLVTPLGADMLALYCRAAEAMDGAFCTSALK